MLKFSILTLLVSFSFSCSEVPEISSDISDLQTPCEATCDNIDGDATEYYDTYIHGGGDGGGGGGAGGGGGGGGGGECYPLEYETPLTCYVSGTGDLRCGGGENDDICTAVFGTISRASDCTTTVSYSRTATAPCCELTYQYPGMTCLGYNP